MIRPGDASLAVYLCLDPVDFRKQATGLSALVQVNLELDPFAPALFAFTNRQRNAVRLLYWERNGFVLWSKKLQRERFHWPRATDDEPTTTLSVQELNFLLDGIDLAQWRPHQSLHYRYAA